MNNNNNLSCSDLLQSQKRQILATEFRDNQTRNRFCCSGIKKTVDTGYVMDVKIGKIQYSGPCCDTQKSCSDKNGKCCNKCYNYCGDKSCNKSNCTKTRQLDTESGGRHYNVKKNNCARGKLPNVFQRCSNVKKNNCARGKLPNVSQRCSYVKNKDNCCNKSNCCTK